ncbi:acyl-CoA dehydrogenase family protein [Phaeobacter sp. 11ANDIMAR09]|uniref:acyl-CoA dehydrogenase family protein n=1 Tax=Phaeobacter sp. 11ANDIMAR09 TaxID=1225647 RepID=UPI0006C84804|nr:acyl-CoA dehydrogenase family protein [Phaeobacter sp. 11ANDIMAR09]KPD14003.1 acyl-CoA dehydrogenase [Phaeobacter sp. 11ANDIMAR09]
MSYRNPTAVLPTHEVTNMPPHMGDQDLWSSDLALREGIAREGAAWAEPQLADFGQVAGREEVLELANQANRFDPELKPFDRYGMRINQVSFHPAYHALQDLAVAHGLPNFAWNNGGAGAHVAHAALNYMLNQIEGGVLCPMAMTYAAIPTLKASPEIAKEWLPKLLSTTYDKRDIPVGEKTSAQMGMFMTEKQGGSDVRANSTRAVRDGEGYRLTGHKFFCSAPMSDAFLTLAYAEEGLSCFLVPRFQPDGQRNGLFLQRLKDKLGNKSNASSEMELQNTWGLLVGPEGKGIKTIIEMVQGTRFYCAFGSSALMRQGLVQALHHTAHRSAFQKLLIDQPLMQNVLADLALESEAATTLSLRLGRAIDEGEAGNQEAAALARIGTAIGKYWICKRAPNHTYEAMECHGGPGYVEESILPRLYREAPVNSIWEGSGNVICLDVLRALQRDAEAGPAFLREVESARGGNGHLDKALDDLKEALADHSDIELRARRLTEQMALVWQAALLVKSAPAAVSDAFCASRLGAAWSGSYGTLPRGADCNAIVQRARGLG